MQPQDTVDAEASEALFLPLRANLTEAGVDECVTLLEGDALQTLADLPAPIDLLLLDGWKSLYLPLLRLLEPRLAENALVLADNVDHAAAQDYLAAIRAPGSGFLTHTLGDLAVSVRLGA